MQLSRWKLFSQLLLHAWTKNISCSKQIQWLLEQKNYSKEKSTSKKNFSFFTKWHFEKFINIMTGCYERIWKLSYGN